MGRKKKNKPVVVVGDTKIEPFDASINVQFNESPISEQSVFVGSVPNSEDVIKGMEDLKNATIESTNLQEGFVLMTNDFNNPEVVSVVNDPEKMDLLTACQRYLVGFRFGWFHGIRRHAESLGLTDQQTAEEWKRALISWGGDIN